MNHSRVSPSSADRAMVCTASVPLIDMLIAAGEMKESDLEGADAIDEETLLTQSIGAYDDVVLDPDRKSDSYSAEGSAYHSVRANCLEFGLDPHHFVGQTIHVDGFNFTITEDLADKLVTGIDWVREHTSAPAVEQKVRLDPWWPGQHGFCDTYWLVRAPKKRFDLYVSDLKFGPGVPVAAENNRQLRLYALGAWYELGRPDIRNVILNIDQPRAGGMKFWEIPFAELIEFGEEAKRVWGRIERGDVEFAPTTKGCQFCPVRKTERGCAAYNKWCIQMLGAAALDMSALEPKFTDPEQMSRAQRYYIVKNAALIKAWLTKLYGDSLAAAISGNPDPGSKAVDGGEGRRYFKDEESATKILTETLGDAAFKKKLIGFGDIDSLMKPGTKKAGHPEAYAALQTCIGKTKAPAKLVSADHPSPAYDAVNNDDFEDL